ncbi:MAG: hypothetical protein WCC26_02780 [Terracidiphilus sp.]
MSIGMTNLDGALQVHVGTFLGRNLIFIRESEMEIQKWFLGFLTGRQTFSNDRVRELRYEEWRESGGRACGIRFKYDGASYVLVKSARESDTLRTIVKIINVYKFSHSLPLQDPELTKTT